MRPGALAWLIAAALMVIAIGLGRAGRTPDLARQVRPSQPLGASFEAREVTVVQTDERGKLQYQLQAARVVQTDAVSPWQVEQPQLHYEPEATSSAGREVRRWNLTADKATLPHDGQLLELIGNVQVDALPRGKDAALRITTPRLSYQLTQQVLHSDEAVQFVWGSRRLSGRGLRADIAAGQLSLESDVHARATP